MGSIRIFLSPKGAESEQSNFQLEWCRFFPNHNYVDIYNLLKNNLPPYNEKENIRVAINGITINFHIEIIDKESVELNFNLSLTGKIANLSSADTYSGKRKGYGTEVINNLRNICDILKAERIDISPLDSGSYAWLKLGFLPNKGPKYTTELVKSISAYKNQVAPETFQLAKEAIENDDPRAWRIIADLPDKVITPKGKEIKLGQALTLGVLWEGKFSLKDKDSIERLELYTKQKRQEMGRVI